MLAPVEDTVDTEINKNSKFFECLLCATFYSYQEYKNEKEKALVVPWGGRYMKEQKLGNYADLKKPVPQVYILYNSVYIIFLK